MLYQLTFKDFQEANRAFFHHQRFWYFFCWSVCAYFAFRGLVSAVYHSDYISGFYNAVMATLLLPLDLNLFRQLSVWLAWKRNSNCHTIKLLEVHPAGYTIIGSKSFSTAEWSTYNCVIETKNLFMLYESRACPFQLFPKRAFGSFEELERFRQLVRSAGLEILTR
jgi:hypothetical protein